MSDVHFLGVLLERRGIVERFQRLLEFSPSLSWSEGLNGLSTETLSGLTYEWRIGIDLDTPEQYRLSKRGFLDIIRAYEDGGQFRGRDFPRLLTISLNIQGSTYANQGFYSQNANLMLDTTTQSTYGPPEKYLYLSLYHSLSHYRQAPLEKLWPNLAILYKVAELLKPTYMWAHSGNELASDEIEVQKSVNINYVFPWRRYSSTMVFGPSLVDELGLRQINWIEIADLYSVFWLSDSILWVNDPFSFMNVDAVFLEKLGDVQVQYEDTAMQRLFRQSSKRHRSALTKLLGLTG